MTNLENQNQNENQENEVSLDVVLINCVPHDVHIIDQNGNYVSTSKKTQDPKPRIEQKFEMIGVLGDTGIPLYSRKRGKVENMPEPQPNTFYIVSGLVAQSFPEREDLLEVGELVRDEQGIVTNCVGLVMK